MRSQKNVSMNVVQLTDLYARLMILAWLAGYSTPQGGVKCRIKYSFRKSLSDITSEHLFACFLSKRAAKYLDGSIPRDVINMEMRVTKHELRVSVVNSKVGERREKGLAQPRVDPHDSISGMNWALPQ